MRPLTFTNDVRGAIPTISSIGKPLRPHANYSCTVTFTNDVSGADTGTATAAESGTGTAQSQFPRKSVNLFFMLVLIKDKLTDLCGD